jgi:adenylate kinase family enzyme
VRRIAVFGPTGCGKTTVSREIGRILGLPVIELDALYHRPGWQPAPVDEFRAQVERALADHSNGWVSDGNYGVVRPLVLSRADTAVWLRLPFPLVYFRLFRRTVARAWRRELLWGTNRESWRRSFFSRDSILLWGITHWRAHFRHVRRDLHDAAGPVRIVELRSHGEIASFLTCLSRSAGLTAIEPAVRPGDQNGRRL